MAEIYPVHKNFSRALPGKHNYELAYNSIFDSKVLTKKLQQFANLTIRDIKNEKTKYI